MKLKNSIIALLAAFFTLAACSDDDNPRYPEPPVYDLSGFAKGADVSWVTEMEKEGRKFYTASGREMECMALLRNLGMNAIRLRVWVNPQNGWCDKNDLLIKAYRANSLGMRLLIDFHYSDTWADPGQQAKPAAWQELSFEELEKAVAAHTKEVLNLLKANHITPEWVQVGNETGNGMLWEEGKASESMENYAQLNNAGYDAVKEVFPDAKVIVHLHNGFNNNLYRWLFDGLKANGGKWDVIGMSLYPKESEVGEGEERAEDYWREETDQCMANIKDMIGRYGSEILLCEVGMPADQGKECKGFLSYLIDQTQAIEGGKCLGVFYWEPQSYGNWNGYGLGAFDSTGKPTVALDAFN